jgi:hypothetical protein
MNAVANSLQALWQEYKFKLLVLESPGEEFEKIFTRLMRVEFDDSFHVSRAGGRRGDMKCDGWDSDSKTLYSVYAPFSVKKRYQIHKKLMDDFSGARDKWPQMRRWRLVHNDFYGLSAEVTRKLEELRSDPVSAGVKILSDWGPQKLWEIMRGLPPADRFDLLGGPNFGALSGTAEWEGPLRHHDNVPAPAICAAMSSLSQLCDNFHPESVLDSLCASVMAGAITSIWLEDHRLFSGYKGILMERCDSYPEEVQKTSIAFTMRTVEVCAQFLNTTTNDLVRILSRNGLDSELEVIIEIALDQLNYGEGGIFVDPADLAEDPDRVKKYVIGCGRTITDIMRATSYITSIPVIFILQDLLISMQRVDYGGGRLIA